MNSFIPAPEVVDKIVMILDGEYGLACKPHLRSDLERLADVRDVVLDFTDVTYVDSTVIVELIRMHRLRDAKGYRPVTIAGQSQIIERFFRLLRLQDVFRIVPNLGDVVEKKEERIGLVYNSWSSELCGGHATLRPGG